MQLLSIVVAVWIYLQANLRVFPVHSRVEYHQVSLQVGLVVSLPASQALNRAANRRQALVVSLPVGRALNQVLSPLGSQASSLRASTIIMN